MVEVPARPLNVLQPNARLTLPMSTASSHFLSEKYSVVERIRHASCEHAARRSNCIEDFVPPRSPITELSSASRVQSHSQLPTTKSVCLPPFQWHSRLVGERRVFLICSRRGCGFMTASQPIAPRPLPYVMAFWSLISLILPTKNASKVTKMVPTGLVVSLRVVKRRIRHTQLFGCTQLLNYSLYQTQR